MEAWIHGVTAPATFYELGGQRFEIGARGFAQAIADAHAAHQRPRCMCIAEGVEMYVARMAGPHGGYIVKRMPDTGFRHAPDCPSYEPPADYSGLGQVLGSAISEDTATGQTRLQLGFPLTKIPGRSQMPQEGGDSDSVATDGAKLSLRGLLHYLWDQAELTRWHPGFAGKRTWGTVRKQLLSAAEDKVVRGDSLRSRLYIPEMFYVDQRDAINTRRMVQWLQALSAPGKPQYLMLLVGEVKDIVPARYGFKAVVKHVPDQAFALDQQLYRRLGRHFETELTLWGASENIHMVLIATFSVSQTGVPIISELSLMPVTRHWLPVENTFDQQLVDRLVHEGRTFRKGLRYNLPASIPVANATLIDTNGDPCSLRIAQGTAAELEGQAPTETDLPPGQRQRWVWHPANGAMPALPKKRLHSVAGGARP
jgi:Protein of unknown function (DUF1173)